LFSDAGRGSSFCAYPPTAGDAVGGVAGGGAGRAERGTGKYAPADGAAAAAGIAAAV
jgi:hypothetical protein